MFSFTNDQIRQLQQLYNDTLEQLLEVENITESGMSIVQAKFIAAIEDIVNQKPRSECLDCTDQQTLRLN